MSQKPYLGSSSILRSLQGRQVMGGQGSALSRDPSRREEADRKQRGPKERLFTSPQKPGDLPQKGGSRDTAYCVLPTQRRDDRSALWPHFTQQALYLQSPLLSNVCPHPHTIPDVNLRLVLLSN